eukprot:m.62276 g.62276  ORF g.62276 m.62276 type:complete len:363 (+) comp35051_c0_seq10:1516-2604(+)
MPPGYYLQLLVVATSASVLSSRKHSVACYDCYTRDKCQSSNHRKCISIKGPDQCSDKQPPCYVNAVWRGGSLAKLRTICSNGQCQERQCTCYCLKSINKKLSNRFVIRAKKKGGAKRIGNPCKRIRPSGRPFHRCPFPNSCRYSPGDSHYRCSCPIRKAGVYCERDVESGFGYFHGYSSAVYETNFKKIDFRLKFKTTAAKNALLLYLPPVKRSKQFLALGLSKGKLELRFNLGRHHQTLRTSVPVVDGKWHTAHLKRYARFNRSVKSHLCKYRHGRLVQLAVDGITKRKKQLGAKVAHFKINPRIYLGGISVTNDLIKARYRKLGPYESGFNGCVAGFKMSNQKVDIFKDALKGKDISPCS